MSAEIVNLRRARKDKRRSTSEIEAAAQRAKHGRTAAARIAEREDLARIARHLDGHRLPPPGRSPGTPDPTRGDGE